MINKQMIIDGVDVRECSWCTEGVRGIICAGLYISNNCSKNPNCYFKQLTRKTQECKELKKYLNQIRDEELSHLDIEWDEYETSARQEDYSNIITLVERALGEIDD